MFVLRTLVALALAAPPAAAPPSDPRATSSESAARTPEPAPIVPRPEATKPTADASAVATPTDPPAEAPVVPAPVLPPPMTPQAEGPVDDSEIDELPYDPRVDSPEAIRARHWVRSGIIFMAVGGVLAIGAIAMSQARVNDPEKGLMPCNPAGDPAGNGCTHLGRRRATAALGVPGGVLLAGGIAMLTVGKVQQKRLAASLRADRRGFFLGVSLRF